MQKSSGGDDGPVSSGGGGQGQGDTRPVHAACAGRVPPHQGRSPAENHHEPVHGTQVHSPGREGHTSAGDFFFSKTTDPTQSVLTRLRAYLHVLLVREKVSRTGQATLFTSPWLV